jgi:two-component system, LytTR family, sensor histidine kinase AgrC
MNNILLKVINYSSIYISFILLMKIYSVLLNKKFKINIIDILILVPLCILVYKISFIDNFALKVLIVILSFFIPYCLEIKLKLPIKDNIFNVVIILLLANIIDFVFSLLVTVFNNIYIFSLYSDALFTIMVPLIILSFIKSKKVMNFFNLLKSIIYKNYKVLIVFIFWLILIFLLTYLNFKLSSNIILMIIVIIAIVFIDLIFFFNVININKINTESLYNYYLTNNLNCYIKYCESLRIYKHNITNKLISLKTVPLKNMQEYIDIILKENNLNCINGNNNNLSEFTPYIYQKLKQKKFSAKKVIINCKTSQNNNLIFNISLYKEVCEILGILLDNAIEASIDSNSSISINIYDNNNILFIEIANNFNNHINITNLGDFLYSTKDNGNGIGIYSLNKNKKIVCNFKIIDNKFLGKVKVCKLKY